MTQTTADDVADYLQELGRATELLLDANSDNLSPEAQTHRFRYMGETEAEALGKAYITRDAIRDAGRECEAEYVGAADDLGVEDMTLHWVEIQIAAESDE